MTRLLRQDTRTQGQEESQFRLGSQKIVVVAVAAELDRARHQCYSNRRWFSAAHSLRSVSEPVQTLR